MRFDGSDDDGAVYTAVKAPGRLIKNEQHQVAKTEVVDEKFHLWYFSPDSNEPHADWVVTYTQSDTWELIQKLDWQTGEWNPVEPPIVVDTSTLGTLTVWSEARFRGPVHYVHGDTHVSYWTQEFVSGDTSILDTNNELVLFGTVECLKSNLTATDAENGDVFLAEAPDVNNPYVFVFEEDQTLYHDVNGDGSVMHRVGLADGEAPASGPFEWGMRSGPLVTDMSGFTDVWELWEATEFYVYETGHNPWNQWCGLLDANQRLVTFDAPLNLSYTHHSDDDRNGSADYHGKTVLLSYNGPGQLWGIPWDEDEDGRWYPRFDLTDGTVITGPQGELYVARAVDIELELAEDPGGAPDLDTSAASDLSLPDSSQFLLPQIGAIPTVTDPPAVIFGQKQSWVDASTPDL